jgi:hypothetical protein
MKLSFVIKFTTKWGTVTVSVWANNLYSRLQCVIILYRGYTMNGAVWNVNTKCMSHRTWAQYTLSAAGSVQASHAYCGASGPVSKMASQQEKAFSVLCFEVSRSVTTVQRELRARFKKTLHTRMTSPGGTDSLWSLGACVQAGALVGLVCLMSTLRERVRRLSEVPTRQWL